MLVHAIYPIYYNFSDLSEWSKNATCLGQTAFPPSAANIFFPKFVVVEIQKYFCVFPPS